MKHLFLMELGAGLPCPPGIFFELLETFPLLGMTRFLEPQEDVSVSLMTCLKPF